MKILSIVVPVFNEESLIERFYERLKRVLEQISIGHEIIYIDDGSTDATLEMIRDQAKKDGAVKVLSFSRNFGHQVAITAGIDFCRGDAAVIIDSDLQDPPELIPEMVKKWQSGFDVVYAVRKRRSGESVFKKLTASIFYRFFKVATEIDMPLDTGDFRLINRRVIDSLKKMPEKTRFIRGLVSWMGYKQAAIEYERDKRLAGETKYPLGKMLRFAMDGIASFSFFPLRAISMIGMLFSAFSFIAILFILYFKFFTERTIVGWASIMLVVLFLGGVQLMSIGVIGEYVGRIFMEVKNRPVYLLREMINFDDKSEKNKII